MLLLSLCGLCCSSCFRLQGGTTRPSCWSTGFRLGSGLLAAWFCSLFFVLKHYKMFLSFHVSNKTAADESAIVMLSIHFFAEFNNKLQTSVKTSEARKQFDLFKERKNWASVNGLMVLQKTLKFKAKLAFFPIIFQFKMEDKCLMIPQTNLKPDGKLLCPQPHPNPNDT